MAKSSRQPKNTKTIRRALAALGPGVITGAADDDPSGIATYSMAGARYGDRLLWTALLTWPLMAAVQMTCARIGMVSGRGLADGLKRTWPRTLVVGAALALLVANTINIAADLAGMSDAAEMLTGVDSRVAVVVFAAGITWATVRLRYEQIARTLKWLALSLFAYVITAVDSRPGWSAILRATFLPAIPKGPDEWQMVVAILGTTISPYLFFWQASQEVEEEKRAGRRTARERRGATRGEIAGTMLDVGVGTFFSNAVMFSIIVTTSANLHARGLTTIATSRQAAAALEPVAGPLAAFLYALGIIGIGALAIPTLSGSAAYALAEVYGWRQGLDKKLDRAPLFYAVILFSTLAALALDFTKIRPVAALYGAAVVNGVLAPILLFGILAVAKDRGLMSGQPSSRLALAVVAITALLMSVAVILMCVL